MKKSIEIERRTSIDPDKELASVISDANVRRFALCEIHAALWGGYDANVDVEGSYTYDKKARHLEMKNNDLSINVSTESLNTETHRSGLVSVKSKEEAFARGIPFFVDNVKLDGPNSLSFQVWSNPGATVKQATPRLKSRPPSPSQSGYVTTMEIVISTQAVIAQPGPVDVKVSARSLNDLVLSLVVSDDHMRCLESNEIDLTPLMKK